MINLKKKTGLLLSSKKKSVYDWLAHLYLDPLGRHHSLYPPSLLAL